jgi:hypothetical protein
MRWLVLADLGMISSWPFCCHGGSGDAEDVFVTGFVRFVTASEMGLRRWTKSRFCSFILGSSSATCVVVDSAGRMAAIWSAGKLRSLPLFLPALMPDGRQYGFKLAFVARLFGICRRRSDGEVFIPSGLSPVVKISVRRWSLVEDGPDCFPQLAFRIFYVKFLCAVVIF